MALSTISVSLATSKVVPSITPPVSSLRLSFLLLRYSRVCSLSTSNICPTHMSAWLQVNVLGRSQALRLCYSNAVGNQRLYCIKSSWFGLHAVTWKLPDLMHIGVHFGKTKRYKSRSDHYLTQTQKLHFCTVWICAALRHERGVSYCYSADRHEENWKMSGLESHDWYLIQRKDDPPDARPPSRSNELPLQATYRDNEALGPEMIERAIQFSFKCYSDPGAAVLPSR